jgi:transposase
MVVARGGQACRDSKEKISATEGLIAEVAQEDEAVGWLRSLPGIGEFFSVLIRHEVEEMERFPSAKKFASYTGLVPSTYASGKRITHGRLTKEGNKWLRWAFIEAVSPAIRSSPYLRSYYLRIKARRGTKDARTATARKLAELAWTVCTQKRPYVERLRLPSPAVGLFRKAPHTRQRSDQHERMKTVQPLLTPSYKAPHTRLGSSGSHK